MRRRAGFTLIEALIAVALFGAVMAILFGAYASGILCGDRVSARLDFFRAEALTFARMDQDARNTLSFLHAGDGFSGGKESFSFFAEVDYFLNASPERDIARITYSFHDGALWRSCRKGKKCLIEGAAAETDTLWPDLKACSFLYAEVLVPGVPIAWQAAWNRTDALPEAVKVTVVPRTETSETIERVLYVQS